MRSYNIYSMEQRITDLEKNGGGGGGGASTAAEVHYDNFDTGLIADNVQDAIDEVYKSVPIIPVEYVDRRSTQLANGVTVDLNTGYNITNGKKVKSYLEYSPFTQQTRSVDIKERVVQIEFGGVASSSVTIELTNAGSATVENEVYVYQYTTSALKTIKAGEVAASSTKLQATVTENALNWSGADFPQKTATVEIKNLHVDGEPVYIIVKQRTII